ncbi:hypothetical protein U5A82_06220 [Sphingobium sp. CR2-8]|uniref:hypothetical protein n=1 Tax=Sphingobium sp. CR2-8 TaxID=1306534 RepID=UPI002DB9B0FC|nr:hypothetical protein [Sphingobium sp. CR2-8]MEC3910084.1 hypothetical protein [Sphingobium sp. CR2-8]
MANFNPTSLKPASQIAEFADKAAGARTAKAVVLDGIKRQVALFKDPKVEGRRWFTSGATHTAFTIRVANKPLKLSGAETKLAVETKDFEAAMDYFAKEISTGKLDAQLDEATAAMDARKAKMKTTRAAKKDAKPEAGK